MESMKPENNRGTRQALRLGRYARLVSAGITLLPSDGFNDDIETNALTYEFINHLDLNGFYPMNARERPRNCAGLLIWRLRPKNAETVRRLSLIVTALVAESCAFRSFMVLRETRGRVIRFRFIVEGGRHAHVGRIEFVGQEVARFIQRQGRRIVNDKG